MGLLDFDDHYKKPFSPRRDEGSTPRENLEALQNLGHAPVSEDFSDSPHADRKPEHGAGSGCPIEMCRECLAVDSSY